MAQLVDRWFDRSTTHWNNASTTTATRPKPINNNNNKKKEVKFSDTENQNGRREGGGGDDDGQYFRSSPPPPAFSSDALRSRTKTWRFDSDEAPTVIEGRRSFSFADDSPVPTDRQLLKLDWNTASDLAGKEPLLLFYSLEGCPACNRFRPELIRALPKLDVQAVELESKDVPRDMLPPEFPTLLYVAPGKAAIMLDSDHGIDAIVNRVNALAVGKR